MSTTTTTTSTSGTRSSSSTSTAPSSFSSTSAFTTLSSAFPSVTAPTSPTFGPGNNGNGGGGGGGGNGNGNTNIVGSAALYLYTFLATLVLLLTVSAAIVFRSFVLRRRHRLMVEEAIRNGTWTPGMMDGGVGGNGPMGRNGARVDLSKKPKMWETYLGGGGLVGYGGHSGSGSGYGSGYGYGGGEKGAWGGWSAAAGGLEAKEWDGIKPVSVSYVASTPTPSSKGAPSDASTSGSDSTAPPTQQQQTQQPNRGVLREAGTFVADLFRTPRMPVLPQAAGGESEEAEMGGSNVPPAKDGERTVRVAVLIAMPRPPSLASHPSMASLSPPEASSSGSGSGSHPLAESAPRIGKGDTDDDGETPLPVLEIGVAEVTVVVGHEDGEAEARKMSGESVELKKGAQVEGASAPPAV